MAPFVKTNLKLNDRDKKDIIYSITTYVDWLMCGRVLY